VILDAALEKSGLNVFALNPHKAPHSPRAAWLGKSPADLHGFLSRLKIE
jgi:hypothetical protein